MCVCVWERERHTHTQTDRQTDRETEWANGEVVCVFYKLLKHLTDYHETWYERDTVECHFWVKISSVRHSIIIIIIIIIDNR